MSKQDSDSAFENSAQPRNQPVICITASPSQQREDLIRAILRTQTCGHYVMVAHSQTASNMVLRYAKRLGATVIDADGVSTDGNSFQTEVMSEAKDAGFPGIIWHQNPTERIDYDASITALHETDEYIVDAEYQTAIDDETTVLVGIPAYNEAERIDSIVTEAAAHADEVLVVDDGSTDSTTHIAEGAGATVVTHDDNEGYGRALQTIFREAARSNADHLVILDGDGQHDPDDIARFVAAQRDEEADIIIGNRFQNGTDTNLPVYRRFGLAVVNLLTNISLGVIRSRARVSDTQSGFRAYNSDAITSLAEDEGISDHMGASTDILHHAHVNGYSIVEVPTTVDYDVPDGSTRNPIEHGITLVMNLVRTIEHERPISLIGIPGFLLVLLGVSFGYWTFSTYIRTGNFPLGLAITSSFFGLVGVFACFTAIILHSLKTHLS